MNVISLTSQSNQLELYNTRTASLQLDKTLLGNKSPGYNNRQSDSETLFLELWETWNTHFIAIGLKAPLARSDNIWLDQWIKIELFDIKTLGK